MTRRSGRLGLLLALLAMPAAAQPAPAPLVPRALAPVPGAAQRVTLEAGQGRVLTLPVPVATLFAADPKVAEVRPASPTALFLMGVGPGRTTIAALTEEGVPVGEWDVVVRPSAAAASEAAAALRSAMPGSRLRVETGALGWVLQGETATAAEAERALSLLRARLPDARWPIENRISVLGAQQVNLRVRIAEVSREVTRQLGLDWQALGSIGRFTVAGATANAALDVAGAASRFAGRFSNRGVDVNAIVDALAQDRLITILAEPNLTASTGETASFLAGGEFPIPVAQRDRNVTIEFKQFGVSLAFVPTVLEDGRIALRVRPEVSELSEQGAIRLPSGEGSVSIPALTVRRAETSVELGSGQSFAIAGLLQDSNRLVGRGVPGLSEVPVLGALFRSDRYQRNETELVIIVTPYLVRPAASPRALAAPTEAYVPPDDAERILRFRQVGERRGVRGTGFTVD